MAAPSSPQPEGGPDPRLAVVIPTYQRAARIERAVRSVLAQEGPPFEVVVVDDGSTDGTDEVLAGIDDSRLRVLRQPNAGAPAARNAGLAVVRAPAVTFLDSDDEALPGWLAEIDRLLDVDRVPVVRLGLVVDRPGAGLERRPAAPLDPTRPFPRGPSQAGSWAAATWLLRKVGGYDPRLPFAENTDLLVRLALEQGRAGWWAAASDTAGVLVHLDPAPARTGRYGSAQRRAAEALLARHREVLRHDRAVRHDYRAIVGVDELRQGRRASAARWLARAWLDRPASLRSMARLAGVALPAGLRDRLVGLAGCARLRPARRCGGTGRPSGRPPPRW